MEDCQSELFRLVHFVEAVRSVDNFLPAQCLHVLLAVAAKPGISQGDLQKITGLARASVSRNVSALSAINRKGELGYGLVASVPNGKAVKCLNIYLTARGLRVLRQLLQAATGKLADQFSPPTAR